MVKYVSVIQLPTFDEFIQAFKVCFTHADDARQLRLCRVAGRDLDQVVICTMEFDTSAYSTIKDHHACAQEPKEG